MTYGVPGYYIRDRLEAAEGQLEDANRRIEQLQNLLGELADYFDNRADCDCDQDGFVPNEEMRILCRIEQEL